MTIDIKKISSVKFGGIDHKDYPEYCDAYIEEFDYDGEPATDEQIEYLNTEATDIVYDLLMNHLF
jgi:hypothetical protein